MTRRPRFWIRIGACVLAIACLAWQLERSWSQALAPVREQDSVPCSAAPLHDSEFGLLAAAESPSKRVAVESSRSDGTLGTGLVTLHGTVVVLDDHDVEHTAESGTVTIDLNSGDHVFPVEVPVERGEWSLACGSFTEYEAGRGILGHRSAFAHQVSGMRTIPADGRVDLRYGWYSVVELHVRDAATGAELQQISIRNGGGEFHHQALLPIGSKDGATKLVGPSPLMLAADEYALGVPVRTLFVHAPGRAWCRLRIDWNHSSVLQITLDPACALDVTITGRRPKEPLFIRLGVVGDPDAVFDALVDEHGTVAIEDCPAGAYVLTAYVGDCTDEVVLARSEVLLVEGIRSRACLTLNRSSK